MNRVSRAVGVLLVINIVVFAAGALVPAWHDELLAVGAFWFPANGHFGPWQGVTYLFLHGSFAHVFFNLFALASFGTVLERQWGTGRFLLFYFLCGVGAGLIQMGIQWHEFGAIHERLIAAGMTSAEIGALLAAGNGPLPADPAIGGLFLELYQVYAAPMLGASGAIYGLLVAFGCLYPHAKLALVFLPVPVSARVFIPVLLALDLLSGVTGFSLFGAGVAHFAHLGGAAIGFLLMVLWRGRRNPAGVQPITRYPT
ncbi:MAG TPA: rhomboid family intramembrane serine protease [Lacunisphaera sp.]|nr:rhomboid family intramembrane serine protease [Lacunisphaera sp.]